MEAGRITAPELRALAAGGKLLPSDQVWKNRTEVKPAGSIKGLFPITQASESFAPVDKPVSQRRSRLPVLLLIAVGILTSVAYIIFSLSLPQKKQLAKDDREQNSVAPSRNANTFLVEFKILLDAENPEAAEAYLGSLSADERNALTGQDREELAKLEKQLQSQLNKQRFDPAAMLENAEAALQVEFQKRIPDLEEIVFLQKSMDHVLFYGLAKDLRGLRSKLDQNSAKAKDKWLPLVRNCEQTYLSLEKITRSNQIIGGLIDADAKSHDLLETLMSQLRELSSLGSAAEPIWLFSVEELDTLSDQWKEIRKRYSFLKGTLADMRRIIAGLRPVAPGDSAGELEYIGGFSHRVEGDLYFLDDKVLRIPAKHLDVYSNGQASANKVGISGPFRFTGNTTGTNAFGAKLSVAQYESDENYARMMIRAHNYPMVERLRQATDDSILRWYEGLCGVDMWSSIGVKADARVRSLTPVRAKDARRQNATKERATNELAERIAFAEKVFSTWKLQPGDIPVTPVFTKAKLQVELRGARYRDVVAAIEAKDWVTALNLVSMQELRELPPVHRIEESLSARTSVVLIFVDTRRIDLKAIKAKPNWTLLLISFRVLTNEELRQVNEPMFVTCSDKWKSHPDKIGSLHEWSPMLRDSIVAFGPPDVILQRQEIASSGFRRLRQSLEEKLKLGEIQQAEVARTELAPHDCVDEDRQRNAQELRAHQNQGVP